jgi:exopolysaccharide biosynthesis protein
MKIRSALVLLAVPFFSAAQLQWKQVDSLFQPLPASMHVYRTNDSLDGKPNIGYYVSVDLKDRSLNITTQVGNGKRLTPSQYFEQEQKPLLVMNCTFFEFVHNSNQNIVVKDGKMLAYQVHSIAGRGKDTFTYRHAFGSAIGITKKRKADVAWIYNDSSGSHPYASQSVIDNFRDSVQYQSRGTMLSKGDFKKWKMQTAVGGGPVLLQNGEVMVTNNQELKFTGKAISDKHPRTAMGYTADGKLILMVIEGRFPNKAEGATLTQEAIMLKQIGCVEALNLDGGGSSCLLINGKETIKPSDKEGQRPVPAVVLINY